MDDGGERLDIRLEMTRSTAAHKRDLLTDCVGSEHCQTISTSEEAVASG